MLGFRVRRYRASIVQNNCSTFDQSCAPFIEHGARVWLEDFSTSPKKTCNPMMHLT